jgi:integrase
MASVLTNSESFDGQLTCSQNVIPATPYLTPVVNENMSTVGSENPSTLRPRAVTGPREENLARRRFQNGQLLLLKKRWSVRSYEDVFENGERRRKRVQRFLGTLAELPTKRLAMRAMKDALDVVNGLAYRPRTTTTFREFATQWVEKCRTRKRRPIKPSTLCNWESILLNHLLPALGSTPLSSVDNRAMKVLVEGLVHKRLSPQTIKNVVQVAKLVKASAVDENGNELYPTKWNHEFIDLPEVDETKQRKPSFFGEQVTKIVKAANGRLQMACVLLAGSGIRAGELLALETRHFDGSSIKVEQDVWGGKVQDPKTPNARRTIDLHPDVAELLKQFIGDRTAGFIFKTSTGKPLTQTNLLKRELHPILATLEIPKRGFHSFRRFRNTHLRNSVCPDGLLKFWMGHASKDMSDRYDRVRDDVVFRKEVAARMGTGFEIPKTLTPKPPKTKKTVSEISVSGVIGRGTALATTLSY